MFKAFKDIGKKLEKKKILYYPGCMTQHALPEIRKKYKELLRKIGVDFVEIDLLKCCGSPALDAGYKKDFEKLKQRNLEILKNQNIGKIITNCPFCYRIFSEEYGLDVEHISETLERHSPRLEAKTSFKATYFDPCNLSRQRITEQPRNLLKDLGIELTEFEKNRKNSMCCGAGAGVKANFPKLADEIAKKRLEKCPTTTIITCCPACYAHLKENAKQTKRQIRVMELSEVIN